MALTFALIRGGIVKNIVVVEDVEFIEVFRPDFDEIIFLDDAKAKNVHMGYHWDGRNFFEDPIIVASREEMLKKEQEVVEEVLKKPEEELDEKEKSLVELMKQTEKELEAMKNAG